MNIAKLLKKIFIDQDYINKLDFLKSISLFSELDKKSLCEIVTISFEKNYKGNETLFKEGDLGRALYIIKSGEVEIFQNNNKICSLYAGDFFGELALLEEVPRTATVKIAKDSKLILIYKVKFDSILEIDPSIGIKLKETIKKRLNKE
jgi:CRP-like cAMP-binding protein